VVYIEEKRARSFGGITKRKEESMRTVNNTLHMLIDRACAQSIYLS